MKPLSSKNSEVTSELKINGVEKTELNSNYLIRVFPFLYSIFNFI
jgi:hypothetical protein